MAKFNIIYAYTLEQSVKDHKVSQENDSELVQFYNRNGRIESKSAVIDGFAPGELNWEKPRNPLTIHEVGQFSVKTIPKIGAIASFTKKTLSAHIRTPIFRADRLEPIDEFVITQTETTFKVIIYDSNDYETYRIEFINDKTGKKFNHFKTTELITVFEKPFNMSGVFSVSIIGYKNEFSEVSRDSPVKSITITARSDLPLPPVEDDIVRFIDEKLSKHNTSPVTHMDIRETMLDFLDGLPIIDPDTNILTFTRHDGAAMSVDLAAFALKYMISYDYDTHEIILTDNQGNETRVPVDHLITVYTGWIGDHIQIDISEDNEIKAILLDATVGFEKLSVELQAKINAKLDISVFELFATETINQITALWNARNILDNNVNEHINDINRHVRSNEREYWSNKQTQLISGTNIKTINNQSILGAGNIEAQGGGSSTNDLLPVNETTAHELFTLSSFSHPHNTGRTAGTATAYTLHTLVPGIGTAISEANNITFTPHANNTGTTPTINISPIGAVRMFNATGGNPAANFFVANGVYRGVRTATGFNCTRIDTGGAVTIDMGVNIENNALNYRQNFDFTTSIVNTIRLKMLNGDEYALRNFANTANIMPVATQAYRFSIRSGILAQQVSVSTATVSQFSIFHCYSFRPAGFAVNQRRIIRFLSTGSLGQAAFLQITATGEPFILSAVPVANSTWAVLRTSATNATLNDRVDNNVPFLTLNDVSMIISQVMVSGIITSNGAVHLGFRPRAVWIFPTVSAVSAQVRAEHIRASYTGAVANRNPDNVTITDTGFTTSNVSSILNTSGSITAAQPAMYMAFR